MIFVDVNVPAVNKTYDFNLDETVPISLVLEEIVEMICQKEHCSLSGEKGDILLCQYSDQSVLSRNKSLEDCGIKDGTKLILV